MDKAYGIASLCDCSLNSTSENQYSYVTPKDRGQLLMSIVYARSTTASHIGADFDLWKKVYKVEIHDLVRN